MHYGIKGLTFLLLLYLVFTASTCVEEADYGPSAEDFTKEKREMLGDLLLTTIINNPLEFTPLSETTKESEKITHYLQTLYDQATHEIRQDRQSTPTNRWNPERNWQVTVLSDDQRYAFSLPGGHFLVSTGFLRSMGKGYEIYYLMAFEAINVSERHLIDNLIAEYNTATLFDLLESQETSNNPSLMDIVLLIKNELAFQDDVIKDIDKRTGELICETSIFDRLGIQPILKIMEEQGAEQYRTTRPSYANRSQYVHDLEIDGCGTIKSTGLYEKMVLQNLP